MKQMPDPELADPRREYASRLAARRATAVAEEQRHQRLGYLRLAIFAAALAIGFLALDQGVLSGWWLLCPAIALIWLGDRLRNVEDARTQAGRCVLFYERAIERLEGRWTGTGETGLRFLNEHHLYAQDLDLFGDGSLFQLLCGARTSIGEQTLAAWLLAPAAPDTILARQEGVTELATKLDFREDIAVLSEDVRKGDDPLRLAAWGEADPILKPSTFRIVAGALSLYGFLAIFAFLAYLFAQIGLLDLPPLTVLYLQVYAIVTALVLGGVVFSFRRRTEAVIQALHEAVNELSLLAGVLRRLEVEQFTSPRLVQLLTDLDVEGKLPSQRLARLSVLQDLEESRHNPMMAAFGLLVLWDLHLAYAIEDWRHTSGPALRRWLTAVGEMEALSSLAGYRYEHPEHIFPELVDGPPAIDGEALGHPLLGDQQVVTNDLRIGGEPQVLIVSGSNMSGKSTMLRTVGINTVLAQAGAPVYAKCLRLTPLAIGASIRIVDSLQEGTSRFYAEIKRLRQIMDATNGTLPVLFFIDEFLHGTNSHDRRIGAEAIVSGLVNRGAIGLVTTHDLALAHIGETLGPRGANIHFQDHLEDGRMRFDYKMQPGIVQKSNAIELMRSVGLDV